MICKLGEQQLRNIHSHLKNKGVKPDPEKSISISNRDIQSCVENYENVKSSEEDYISSEFASNAGGMTTYHYVKVDNVLYILVAWMGDADQMYTISDNWVNHHKVIFENMKQMYSNAN